MAADPILSRQLQAMAFFLVGMGLSGLALYLRVRVFIGKQPGGVDTWYYLASASALRRQKRIPIALPQYLLHDRTESYPIGFILFLAAFSEDWLRRYHWLLSPLIDTVHLLLLYLLTFRLTDSVLSAATAGLVYALTPQLISETRNLNGRAFASLIQTLAMLALLRSAIPSEGPTSQLLGHSELLPTLVATLLIVLLFNTHTSTTIAFVVSTAVVSAASGNPRFIVLALLGLPLAIVLSGTYYLRVISNHLHAARFWAHNVRYTRAHQIEDSPLFGASHPDRAAAPSRGLYASAWRARGALVVRVLGENPFILPMLLTGIPANVWAFHMYWWSVAILGWSLLTTFGGPFRILGPGFHYMKASVFPTAYTLAVTLNMQEGLPGFNAALLLAFLGCFGALAYFYRVMALRTTEHTAQTPPDLARGAEYLRGLAPGNVLVLPTMFADFVTFHTDKPVVWGGHSGDLSRLDEFFPVIRKPLTYFFERYHVQYVVLDLSYTSPERLHIAESTERLEQFGSIAIYAVRSPAVALAPSGLGARDGGQQRHAFEATA